MSYQREHYTAITEAIKKRWGLKNESLPPRTWLIWNVAIKRLFDEGILISEIIGALPEAEQKGHWPLNTAFWHRVRDVVLKNRMEANKPRVRIGGLEGMGAIMERYRAKSGEAGSPPVATAAPPSITACGFDNRH